MPTSIRAACEYYEETGSVSLNLSHIDLSKLLPDEVGILMAISTDRLREVKLNDCHLEACSTKFLDELFTALSAKENLILSLYYNFKTASANAAKVGKYLAEGSYIGLQLERNPGLVLSIPEIVKKNRVLKVLECSQCGLGGLPDEHIQALCAELETHPTIQYLNFSDSDLGSAVPLILTRLAAAITKAPQLRILKLGYNDLFKLEFSVFKRFIDSVFNSSTLTSLDIQDNYLEPKASHYVFEQAIKCPQLNQLSYSNNEFLEGEETRVKAVLSSRASARHAYSFVAAKTTPPIEDPERLVESADSVTYQGTDLSLKSKL